ncbi:unnamed protein product [Thelazia callipaeda]|uniref:Uncharacterized protein n=1 Tax=Thelazia callipaeda TaxID=103827 RepID=A0A0N5CR72_THECL|nr:unnamed protein product [Thelazia callipaeda]
MEKYSTCIPEQAERVAGRVQQEYRNTIQRENQEGRKEDNLRYIYIILLTLLSFRAANKDGSEMQCRTKIIPYVMTGDGIVTNFHRHHAKQTSVGSRRGIYPIDEHNKSERGSSTARVPQYDSTPE